MNRAANYTKKIWQRLETPEFLFFFVAVWTAIVMLGGIGYGDLSGYDDAAYAHEAKTMLQTNDWWTMNLNGAPDFDKPPLFIWLLVVSFKIFGANDFAAKIPGVLLGWATIVLVYFLAREIFADAPEDSAARKWLPVLSMLSLATTQYFLKYSSHAMTDVPFAFFFTLSVYLYVSALKNNFFLLASGAAIGLATLVRSPMGLFPLGIIVIHLIFIRRFKLLFSVHFVGCLLLAALLPATWYWREYNLYGDVFITRHFANILGHSASAQAARTAWQQFLWYFEYFFLIVKLYFPWFPLMFYGLFLAARKVRNNFALVENSAAEILLIVWIVVILVPFSLAESKVLRYILPVFPAFAVLSAYALCNLLSLRRLQNFARLAVLLLALAELITTAFPNYLTRAGDMRAIAPISDAATESNEKVLLYTSGEYQANYQTQLLWYGSHLCVHLKDLNEVEKYLSGKRRTIAVMDKPSFAEFAKQTGANIKILSETENFVCFRAENSL
ncbi:MAG: glycosyltransferase family 39 protein [Acidobacteriota bacterium]|nr:glycosyltransferase family 39 protein [Acidobacteriota bacterium]